MICKLWQYYKKACRKKANYKMACRKKVYSIEKA